MSQHDNPIRNFISVCLKLPNIGTLVFYGVFVVLIPLSIIYSGSVSLLKYYLPFLVMLASVLTVSGKNEDLFVNLYSDLCEEDLPAYAFISKYLINLLAIIGILLSSISIAMVNKNIELGLAVGLIAFVLTFPVANHLLPFLINRFDRLLSQYETNDGRTLQLRMDAHKYVVGFILIIVFLTSMKLIEEYVKKNTKRSKLMNNLSLNKSNR